MEYRRLGQTGLQVSSLCLGAMTFGETSVAQDTADGEPSSHTLIEAALDAGINFIDTADIYGQDGLSERLLGQWFAGSKRRHEVVLATKFRFGGDGPNQSGASRHRIMKCVEDSLRRLQTDYIDLYQIHMQDLDTPEEETLRALDDLVRQGKVRYLGCSSYAAYRLMESLWISDKLNLHRHVSLQAEYNLVSRHIEREHVPLSQRHGLGILAWSPLGGGFLTGKHDRDQAAGEGPRFDQAADWFDPTLHSDKSWATLDVVRSVARDIGASPAQVSLAWLLRQPGVTSVIIGARTREQLAENVAATRLELDADSMDRLDAVSAIELGYPYDFMKQTAGGW